MGAQGPGWREDGAAARPTKGSKLDTCADYLLGLIATAPHISLKETQAVWRKRRACQPGSARSGASSRLARSRSKTAHAAEQDRTDVVAAREAWFAGQLDLDPARLVFIDETGLSTKMARLRGRCTRGERLRSGIPHGHWRTTTFVAGLRLNGFSAPTVIDGPMTRP